MTFPTMIPLNGEFPMYRPRALARITLVLTILLSTGLAGAAGQDGFEPLFDGKTLRGWHTLPGGKWEVKDGMIVGTSPKSESKHGLLVTNETFDDFTVRFKFRVLEGNSGFYFRSEPVEGSVGVHGFQAEVENSQAAGGLYETGGRAWVAKPDPQLIDRVYRPKEWNEMSITAVGQDVTVRLNGHQTVQLQDDPGRTSGVMAMQLHGGMDMKVMFKDIEVRRETPSDDDQQGFVPMFNGEDLTGWQTTGNWKVLDDGLVTLIPRPGEHGWQRYSAYLTTKRKYKNFVLDLEFKINEGGNSGVFLRVDDRLDQVETGFEVQILDTHGKENPTNHDCGGVIRAKAPSKNMAKPAGQWNRYIITCVGDQLEVVLNGERIIDMDLSKSPLKDRPEEGYIGFQDEAKRVWYRNVRIKELPDEAGA
jgi:hypothetical protein